jgi:hypothetical protein
VGEKEMTKLSLTKKILFFLWITIGVGDVLLSTVYHLATIEDQLTRLVDAAFSVLFLTLGTFMVITGIYFLGKEIEETP